MKNKIIKIIISIALLAIALLLKTDFNYIKIGLFIISYLVIGFDVIKKAIKKIVKGEIFNEHFLMTIATLGALAIKEYPEAITVMILYSIGEVFEELGESKSKKSISDLMDIRPEVAYIKDKDGNIKKKKPEDVNIGEIIVVKPGEKIPLDGIVIEGKSTLDMSALTGESIPKQVKEKEEVLNGTINISSLLTIKVTKLYKESTVSKILELVENAENKKAKTENFITKFSKIYTPIVVFLAIIIFIAGILSKTLTVNEWLYRALTFLVISCPCALVISVPLSFFSGIGKASKQGILIKGSSYMDILSNIDTVVFDKTGTLTKGKFEVQEIVTTNKFSKEELLKYASISEHFSNHPIAKAIKDLYKTNVDINKVKNVEEIAGKGIKCEIDGKQVICGNLKLLENHNIKIEENKEEGIVIYIAVDKEYAGKIIIADSVKEESFNLVENLKKIGIKNTVILTGDKLEEAEKIAKKIKIDKVYSNLLPDEKTEKLEQLINYNKINNLGKVAFVGDGINDSPSLARADVGIAMGALGSDSAIEASDVVIMTDKLEKIISAIKISKRTIKIAKQNIIFALSIKILVLVLSALGITNMWMAVFADVGVTLIAILNSLK